MSKRFVPAASVLAAVMAFQAHHAAGADDCVVEPTHQPPDGQHWYYRFDQAKNRKCWHLGEAGLTVQRPPPDLPRPPGRSRIARAGATRRRSAGRGAMNCFRTSCVGTSCSGIFNRVPCSRASTATPRK